MLCGVGVVALLLCEGGVAWEVEEPTCGGLALNKRPTRKKERKKKGKRNQEKTRSIENKQVREEQQPTSGRRLGACECPSLLLLGRSRSWSVSE